MFDSSRRKLVDMKAGNRCSAAHAGVDPNGDLRANGAHANEQEFCAVPLVGTDWKRTVVSKRAEVRIVRGVSPAT
jgi:hypothetical protein